MKRLFLVLISAAVMARADSIPAYTWNGGATLISTSGGGSYGPPYVLGTNATGISVDARCSVHAGNCPADFTVDQSFTVTSPGDFSLSTLVFADGTATNCAIGVTNFNGPQCQPAAGIEVSWSGYAAVLGVFSEPFSGDPFNNTPCNIGAECTATLNGTTTSSPSGLVFLAAGNYTFEQSFNVTTYATFQSNSDADIYSSLTPVAAPEPGGGELAFAAGLVSLAAGFSKLMARRTPRLFAIKTIVMASLAAVVAVVGAASLYGQTAGGFVTGEARDSGSLTLLALGAALLCAGSIRRKSIAKLTRLAVAALAAIVCAVTPARAGTIAVIDTPAGAVNSSVIFFNSTTLRPFSAFTASGILSDLAMGAGLDVYATMGSAIVHYDIAGDVLRSLNEGGVGNSLSNLAYVPPGSSLPNGVLVADQTQGESELLIGDTSISSLNPLGLSPVTPVTGLAYDSMNGIYIASPNAIFFSGDAGILQASAGVTLGDITYGSGPGASFLYVTATSSGTPVVYAVTPGLGSVIPFTVSTSLQSIAAGSSTQYFELYGTSGNQLFDEGALDAPVFNTLNSYTGAANDNFTDVAYSPVTDLRATPEPGSVWLCCGIALMFLCARRRRLAGLAHDVFPARRAGGAIPTTPMLTAP